MAPEPQSPLLRVDGQPGFSTLRAVCRYANHEHRLGTAVFLLLFGGMFCLMPALMFWQYIPYWTEGVRVSGNVSGRDPVAAAWRQPAVLAAAILAHGGGGRGPTHFIEYEFQDQAGRLRQGRSGVDVATWSQLRPGDNVDVVFLRSDPAKSKLWVGLDNGQWVLVVFGTIGLLIISFGIRSLVGGTLSIRREVALLRNGILTQGQVVEVTNDRYDSRSVKSTLRYSFAAPTTFAGPPQERQGTYVSIGKPWFKGQQGDAVPVVYSPDDPGRSTIDRFALRAPQ